jgi:hypothetical protein
LGRARGQGLAFIEDNERLLTDEGSEAQEIEQRFDPFHFAPDMWPAARRADR